MKYLILSLLSFFALSLGAQDFSLHVSPKGIIIQCYDQQIPKSTLIERAEGNGKFTELARLSKPNSPEEVKLRLLAFAERLPLRRPLNLLTEDLWETAQTGVLEERLARDPENRIALGMGFYDHSAKAGKRYRYRINGREREIQFKQPETYAFEWSLAAKSETGARPEALWISTSAFEMQRMRVYRSLIGQEEVWEINPIKTLYRTPAGDSILASFTDTSVVESGQYTYTVELFDRFGVPGNGLNPMHLTWLNPDQRPRISRFAVDGQKLNWTLERPKLARSLHIYRGRSTEGPFERVASLLPHETSWEDQQDIPMEAMFYYIQVNDLDGEKYRSLFASHVDEQELTALPPDRFEAVSGPEGVQLIWSPARGMVRGYRVYRRDGYRGEWEPASGFLPADSSLSWVDHSAVLQAGKVYTYAVRAESESYSLSELSPASSVRIPSTESLPATQWIEAVIDNNQVVVSWENMFARVPALKSYRLYRRSADSKEEWMLIADSLDRKSNRHIDKSLREAGGYAYSVVVTDIFGNESELSQEALIEWKPSAQGPQHLTALKVQNGILLEWSPPGKADQILVYRLENGADWELIESSDHKDRQHLDTNVTAGQIYEYKIVARSFEEGDEEAAYPVVIRY
ncbi:MAG: fibronectin type III domain-containing protein [Bacteroidetes bacterium]|nr:fibronectin type III domain-containing protein [Bacteroidota bacterium]